MSNRSLAGENRGGKSRYLNGGGSLLLRAPLEPDDEQGGAPRSPRPGLFCPLAAAPSSETYTIWKVFVDPILLVC